MSFIKFHFVSKLFVQESKKQEVYPLENKKLQSKSLLEVHNLIKKQKAS